jgi:excinuclease ABC subunit B
MTAFKLESEYQPAGDQPEAIKQLVTGFRGGKIHQTLLGVTGSGKTFTVANVIQQLQKPTLVIAHNKTLAAQLATEYREFFPHNAVQYFVSYYDYYQPEAYVAISDTYIEKEAQINEEIDRLRHATTQSLLTRSDVIVVASVSCIYGLGSPEEYEKVNLKILRDEKRTRADLIRELIAIYFERTNADLTPGTFRAVGNSIEIMPVNERVVYRIQFGPSEIEEIQKIDAVAHTILERPETLFVFPAKHFVTNKEKMERALLQIKEELDERLKTLEREGKPLEAERLRRRTTYDIALIREVGYVSGIENYSRHFDGRQSGEPPFTLLDYFPHDAEGNPDFLTVIDESHVSVPQIGGMYAGDRARKNNLVEYGFRLLSAIDNRPLQFEEFQERIGQVLYTTATPKEYELEKSGTDGIAEQIIRPTGLVDPQVEVRPIQESADYKGQIQNFIQEAEAEIVRGGRVMVTTLTKRMAEDLSEYLAEKNMKAIYIHSDIKTIERVEIIRDFRKGIYDVLVGVNLLREGLDMPEVSLIAILDADKEGFLRSEVSLIQTIGRAARNVGGRVILYADRVTGSMERALGETERRRNIQIAHNTKHGITPQTIKKKISDMTDHLSRNYHKTAVQALEIELKNTTPKQLIKKKQKAMSEAVKMLDFETAAILRDEMKELKERVKKKKKK